MTIKYIPIFVLLALWTLPVRVQAQAHFSSSTLPASVSAALKSADIPEDSLALIVQEVDAAEPAIRLNASQAMNPASLMKLLTTYGGLEILGPSYTWKTEAYATGSIHEGVLEGDLILKGYGDPALTMERFWLLLRQIRSRGIHEIRGDLVLDRSYFSSFPYDPSKFDQLPLRPYNVSPDALLVNYKTVRLHFLPSRDQIRGQIQVLTEPSPTQLQWVNQLSLVNQGACDDVMHDIGIRILPSENKTLVMLKGTYPVACGEQEERIAVLDHPQYVWGLFQELWQALGGTVHGTLREGKVPANAQLLARLDSPPLTEVVREINKFSNNVMAQQLYLTIGAHTERQAGSYENAAKGMRAWLNSKGFIFNELQLENGVGLSRKERISAQSLAQLLLAAYHSPVMPEFMASLPIVGVDGTMKNRLNDQGIAEHAHIKTGSLDGVKTMAGYVLDRNGRYWVVVFMVNHAHAAAARIAQDKLLEFVYSLMSRTDNVTR